MLTQQEIEDVVRDSLVTLNEEKEEGEQIPIADETVLFGVGAMLKSLDFVLIVTAIEERLYDLTGREIEIGKDLQTIEEDNPFRTVATLRGHIARILESTH